MFRLDINVSDAGKFGEEAGAPRCQRILGLDRSPKPNGLKRECVGQNTASQLRQDDIDSNGAQIRALARHIRSAHKIDGMLKGKLTIIADNFAFRQKGVQYILATYAFAFGDKLWINPPRQFLIRKSCQRSIGSREVYDGRWW